MTMQYAKTVKQWVMDKKIWISWGISACMIGGILIVDYTVFAKDKDKAVVYNAYVDTKEYEGNMGHMVDSFGRMRQSMDSMMQHFFADDSFWGTTYPGSHGYFSRFGFSTGMDMRRDKDMLIISADLPGMQKEDIHLMVDDRILTVSGQRKRSHEGSDTAPRIYHSERKFGQFSQQVRLPEGVDEDSIMASYENGVLEIRMRYVEEEKERGKRIPIS